MLNSYFSSNSSRNTVHNGSCTSGAALRLDMLLLDEEEEEKVEGAELVIGKRPCDRVRINTTLVKMELKPEEEKGIVDGLLDDVE
jgi:hypothetical protein